MKMKMKMKNFINLILFSALIISCSKKDEVILDNNNFITSFKLTVNGESINGIINENSKQITFNTKGAQLNSLTPTISYSKKASIFPQENSSQNFNNTITYSVTAENGDVNSYNVIVNNTPFSSKKEITKFSTNINGQEFIGVINEIEKTISLNVGDVDLRSIKPNIEISEFATLSPSMELEQNFQNEFIYTVTAENQTSQEYKIKINWPSFLDTGFGNVNTNFFINAESSIIGENLSTNFGGELYFSDGNNIFNINVIDSYIYNQGTNQIRYEFIFENNMNTSIYKIFYKRGDLILEHAFDFNIVKENAPNPISASQSSYSFNDVLKINGTNLTDTIYIPSNGSIYAISNGNNYDISVNQQKTEMSFTLSNQQFFPSYYGNSPQDKKITFLKNGRIGKSITLIFN